MPKRIPLAFFALKEHFLLLDRAVNSRSGSETWNQSRFLLLSSEILKGQLLWWSWNGGRQRRGPEELRVSSRALSSLLNCLLFSNWFVAGLGDRQLKQHELWRKCQGQKPSLRVLGLAVVGLEPPSSSFLLSFLFGNQSSLVPWSCPAADLPW